MGNYKNNTSLPEGIFWERILTITPEIKDQDAAKVNIIEWSDEHHRELSIDNIVIKQYDKDWQNEIVKSEFIIELLDEKSDDVYKLEDGNRGFAVFYKPFVREEEYELWYIVTITLKDCEPFDVAFYSSIKGGHNNGQQDLNKPPRK